jgi:sarcosine/dimethylglycine N-methyltransferase
MRNGIGIDFSARMCQQCAINNKMANMSDVIEIRNESFLDMSVEDESMDVVISMDAFYHVGAERHRQVRIKHSLSEVITHFIIPFTIFH